MSVTRTLPAQLRIKPLDNRLFKGGTEWRVCPAHGIGGVRSSHGAGIDANKFHKLEFGRSAFLALVLRAGAGAKRSPG
jgi:hypothetical protein